MLLQRTWRRLLLQKLLNYDYITIGAFLHGMLFIFLVSESSQIRTIMEDHHQWTVWGILIFIDWLPYACCSFYHPQLLGFPSSSLSRSCNIVEWSIITRIVPFFARWQYWSATSSEYSFQETRKHTHYTAAASDQMLVCWWRYDWSYSRMNAPRSWLRRLMLEPCQTPKQQEDRQRCAMMDGNTGCQAIRTQKKWSLVVMRSC